MTRRGRHPLRAGRLRKKCGFRKKGIAFRKSVWYNSRATRCGCSSVGQSTCLTCKGSLVQVHSSTPLKPLAKAGGFSVIYTLHAVRIPCFGAFVRPRKGGVKALIPEISQYIDLPVGRAAAAVDGLACPALLLDLGGKVLFANSKALVLFGDIAVGSLFGRFAYGSSLSAVAERGMTVERGSAFRAGARRLPRRCAAKAALSLLFTAKPAKPPQACFPERFRVRVMIRYFLLPAIRRRCCATNAALRCCGCSECRAVSMNVPASMLRRFCARSERLINALPGLPCVPNARKASRHGAANAILSLRRPSLFPPFRCAVGRSAPLFTAKEARFAFPPAAFRRSRPRLRNRFRGFCRRKRGFSPRNTMLHWHFTLCGSRRMRICGSFRHISTAGCFRRK